MSKETDTLRAFGFYVEGVLLVSYASYFSICKGDAFYCDLQVLYAPYVLFLV